jgi:hypothetical protein
VAITEDFLIKEIVRRHREHWKTHNLSKYMRESDMRFLEGHYPHLIVRIRKELWKELSE